MKQKLEGDRQTGRDWNKKNIGESEEEKQREIKVLGSGSNCKTVLQQCLLIEGKKLFWNWLRFDDTALCYLRYQGKQQQPSGGKLRLLTVCDASGREG